MFSGSIPALVTLFRDGAFDEGGYREFVEWQIAEGSAALVACGTTGEAATLTFAEHFEVVRICVDQARGRVPVIAGAGSNDTQVAITNVRAAREAGADAALMVPPYYNRPNQDGIFAHFEAVVAACDLPIMLYNVPGRTVTDMAVITVARLARTFPTIVAIKDATGDLARVSAHRDLLGPDFVQLSGNDDLSLAFNAIGGRGCVSVTANVAPALCARLQQACLDGHYTLALEYHDQLFALHTAMFTDASPGPVKYALNRLKPRFSADLRLPMTPPSEGSRAAVDAAMLRAGLL